MQKLEQQLFSIEQIRICEQYAIENLGISEHELMQRAGKALFRSLKKFFPEAHNIAIFCGAGNNAGDGYVLAKIAHLQGLNITVYQSKKIEDLPAVAQDAAIHAVSQGIICQMLEDSIEPDTDLIVDGLLGIGINGEVQGAIAYAIDLINEAQLPVLAIDIPSGLDADTGMILGSCVKANVTVTFIGKKRGLYTLDGPDYAGEIVFDDLQLDRLPPVVKSVIHLLHENLFNDVIAPRLKNSHKTTYGKILIIGGGPGMPGAIYLAAQAAYKVGAGLVTLATFPEHAGKVLPHLPEAILYGIESQEDLLPLLDQSSVVIIGPGLGESKWAQSLFDITITTQLPLVIDASALRMLARNPQHDDNWILTPHPGEAASLLHVTVPDIQENRFQAVDHMQQLYGGTIILKGVGSLIKDSKEMNLCPAGNPGMATAGMGDVLSGIIGGLLGQGVNLSMAAKLGVWLHAKAADEAVARHGERGLLASDLMSYLRRLINNL